jgi:hypothetical protein
MRKVYMKRTWRASAAENKDPQTARIIFNFLGLDISLIGFLVFNLE